MANCDFSSEKTCIEYTCKVSFFVQYLFFANSADSFCQTGSLSEDICKIIVKVFIVHGDNSEPTAKKKLSGSQRKICLTKSKIVQSRSLQA